MRVQEVHPPDRQVGRQARFLPVLWESTSSAMVRPLWPLAEGPNLERVDPSNALPRTDPPEGMPAKYRIIKRLASGGMAHIYLAALEGPDGFQKMCVVKRILPEYASLESFTRMFVHEAKVAAFLHHPNIV